MIFIDQTQFGYPEGNCYSACLASILEAPLGSVPRFYDPSEPVEQPGWNARVNRYLERWNLWRLVVCVKDENLIPGDAITILSGKSPRGEFMHSVVGSGLRVVHDPHPSRAGLHGTWRDWEVELLVPKRITHMLMQVSSRQEEFSRPSMLTPSDRKCLRCNNPLLKLNNQCPDCGQINP